MAPQSSPDDGVEPAFVNPAVADNISNPPENQVKSFFVNLGLVTAAVVAVIIFINLAATYFTPFIPFKWEKGVVGSSAFEALLDEKGEAKQTELRRIGAALTDAMELPPEMSVTVFYRPEDTINAFATLGGNIIVFQGLIDLVESEDELAMVLAHEIGHVKNRDAVKGVVRAVGLALLFAGVEDSGGYVNQVMSVGMSSYSRSQEKAADIEAVRALGTVYGHAGGAERFFTRLAEKVEKRSVNEETSLFSGLSSTHPDTLARLQECRAEAERNGYSSAGEPTPLSDVFE